ncbi:palmitoyltransferase pfa5 [Puttea exsequens]|nr:palmitoyltransferase pfa5 [Puttea exsequens]
MTGSSLQFALQNTTTIENLSRKSIVWTLAIYMPEPPETPPGFRTISYSLNGIVRTFAILHTKPGESPFDLGPYQNFKSVMGEHWFDWLVPLKYSPCSNHSRGDSQFLMGPTVQRMRRDAGIAVPRDDESDGKQRRRRRKKRRRRHRADDSMAEEARASPTNHFNEKIAPDTAQRRGEIDLEAGLEYRNGSMH